MGALDDYLDQSGLERPLIDLVRLRASQMNRCAYCIDMHWKDLRAIGESEQRLYGLETWRESPYYSDRERAALAWAEAVTLVARDSGIGDDVFADVEARFTHAEIADLTLAIGTVNLWNRLSIAARLTPGSYRSSLTAAV